jgi:hypothetical protein
MHSHMFTFSRASRHQFLSCGRTVYRSLAHGEHSAGMTLHIRVYSVGCVHPPCQHAGSTRLQKADRDDYKKLARVMKYLQLTVNLPLTLSCDGSGVLTWYMVGGRILRCTPGYEGSYRRGVLHGPGCGIQYVHTTKTADEKLD